MEYKVGDKVRIKPKFHFCSVDSFNNINMKDEFFNEHSRLPYCETVMTIGIVNKDFYILKEDRWAYKWTDEMIECKVGEEDLIPKFGEYSDNEPLDVPTMITEFVKEHGLPCPEGYIFKDENGNVINATKIVLKKKKKDVSLTQEQINTIVHDSCVLFCKHCGCGIPRDTCTSLGTCKEHDEYRTAIRTHLMEKKKKEYPKTYEECCNVLSLGEDGRLYTKGYKASLI